jgi:16S rRNA (cytosine967-C5)-methyltransferase
MPSIARIAAYNALLEWAKSQADPHIIISGLTQSIKKHEDAAFARELFFGSIKFQRKIDYYSSHYFASKKLAPRLKQIIRLGFYQLLQTTNIPDYAIVSETVELARTSCPAKQAGFVNAVLRNYIRDKTKIKLPDPDTEPVKFLGIEYSYPGWLVERYIKRFGLEQARKLLEWGNTPPKLCFFVNRSIADESKIERELDRLKIEYQKLDSFTGCYQCFSPGLLLKSRLFDDGAIIISDPAQSLAPRALHIPTGETVLDLFAAPGGKTAALAAMVGAEGQVIAIDFSIDRLKTLKSNLNRWRLKNVLLFGGDALKFASRQNFRYILADVPCSGTGTIRRNPDLRWKLTVDDIGRQAAKQIKLLKAAADLLKPGGRIVYSTCSLEAEENGQIIESFLKQNGDFRLIDVDEFNEFKTRSGMYEVSPLKYQTDGAFVAVMERD